MTVISRVLNTSGPLLGAMLLAAVLMPAAGVRADELDVLKGRAVRVIIGGAPGETTDTDSRTFLTYLQAVLPQTTLRLQNDGGNGGASAILELFNASGRVITLATF